MNKFKPLDIDKINDNLTDINDDEWFRIVAKVKKVNPVTHYPTWFDEIQIPPGTVPSQLGGYVAYNKMMLMYKQRDVIKHPVYTVDRILVDSDIRIDQGVLVYEEDKKTTTLNYTRGYFCMDKSSSTVQMVSAHVADCVTYYTRCDPSKMSITPTVEELEAKKLMLKNVECTEIRGQLVSDEGSETKARDLAFNRLIAQPELAYFFCNMICKQNLDFAIVHRESSILYSEALQKIKSKKKKDPVMVPQVGIVNAPNFPTDDRALKYLYDYLTRSRGIRGDDGGIGNHTIGYIYGSMPRSIVKYITLFLDIRQLMKRYRVSVIFINGNVKDMVIRMLIRNNYFVINLNCGITNRLTKELFQEKKYGLYSSLEADIPYGIFHEVRSQPPTKRNGIFEYTTVDVDEIFCMVYGAQESVVFRALRSHMSPQLEKKKCGFLPSSLPHNGQVICVSPKNCTFEIGVLARRAAQANFFRNNFLIFKRLWYTIDIFTADCGYLESFVIPKMNMRTKEGAIDYSINTETITLSLDDVKVNEIPTDKLKTHNVKESDPDAVYQEFISEIKKCNDIGEYAYTIMINWDTNMLPVALKQYRALHPEILIDEICDTLVFTFKDEEGEILDGLNRGRIYLNKHKKINPLLSDEESKIEEENEPEQIPEKAESPPNDEEEIDFTLLPPDKDDSLGLVNE